MIYISIVGLNSAECFDVHTGEWKMISPMSTRRSSVGVGVLNSRCSSNTGSLQELQECINYTYKDLHTVAVI